MVYRTCTSGVATATVPYSGQSRLNPSTSVLPSASSTPARVALERDAHRGLDEPARHALGERAAEVLVVYIVQSLGTWFTRIAILASMTKAFLVAQALFLCVFVLRMLTGRRTREPSAPRAKAPRAAPRAHALVLFHAGGAAVVSVGISRVLDSLRLHLVPSPRTVVGLGAVFAASALAMWALRVFTSWRLLAKVDVGHALCVEGPYQFVRHPLYGAMDLWAVGSALACPTAWTIAGVAIVIIGSDLRSRTEERLLLEVFGEEYRKYAGRVWRRVPCIY
jgi:protein-S-isoprenylcysteine O-methyltransferase Ste14